MGQEPKPRPKIDPATLGRRIVNRRNALDMDQGELAIRSELSRAYVSRLENGLVANPKLFDLESIARVLSIPLAELVAPEVEIVETRYSLDWLEIQQQVAHLPEAQRERILRSFRASLELAFGTEAARQN